MPCNYFYLTPPRKEVLECDAPDTKDLTLHKTAFNKEQISTLLKVKNRNICEDNITFNKVFSIRSELIPE